ncbi:hypothetical protein DSM19430T_29690 [Desulfovibrio psychrotolerans]|uniref:Uncharacterized protein n=2 Tax=Desulfovibrio psychrotolerans TaxID=415242 RepID=A0A7J0BYM0_9BACT|nr:hypothetical protein DSM19430T_29690 [Desulfovibrio psychrotolerans]
MPAKKDKDINALEEEVLVIEARRRSQLLGKYCAVLAGKRGYKNLEREFVLYRYFAETYHWTPSQVRELTTDEIYALLPQG